MRNVLFGGGPPGHDFGALAHEVGDILSIDGTETEIVLDPGELPRAINSETDLVTILALRWRMLDPRYEDRRPEWAYTTDPALRLTLEQFVLGGGGLLALHTAVVCFDDWDRWGDILGATWKWDVSSHGPQAAALVEPTGWAHPITDGIGSFSVDDEVYEHLDPRSDLEPLLVVERRGRPEPVLWARTFGRGRVVVDTLGHDVTSWRHPSRQILARRSCAWALGRSDGHVRGLASPDGGGSPRTNVREQAHEGTRTGAEHGHGKEFSWMDEQPTIVTVTDGDQAISVLRSKVLHQALYDAGEVVMADVLVNLHGTRHRDRRRLENRLFRKDTHEYYERVLFPDIIESTMRPHVLEGRTELVSLGHEVMMNLAALTAGVDRPLGSREETLHLYAYLMTFIEGATLAHYSGDMDAKRAEVQAALGAFDGEFLQPSIARRRQLLDRFEAGSLAEEDLPKDVLTVLLRNQEGLELPSDVVLRETCYFLLAGAHTSATAFTRTLHNLFEWFVGHPGDEDLAREDLAFVQRAVHETVRLSPSSPVAMRWASEAVDIGDLHIAQGAKVVVDMVAVNHDRAVWGADAADFNPERVAPEGRSAWGMSFGSGMHACIGQDLAAGLAVSSERPADEHLYGLVPVAVQWMLDNGARPDPAMPPVLDETSERGYWKQYPVLFEPVGSQS